MLLTVLLSLILFQSTLDFNGQTLLAPEFSPQNTKMTYCEGVYTVVAEPIDNEYFLLQKGSETHKLYVPDSNLKKRSHIVDISMDSSSLFLLDVEKQVFEFKCSNNEFTFVRHYEIPMFCFFIESDDDYITCFNSFESGDNKNSESQTYIYRISRTTGEGKLRYFENPLGKEYSLIMPRKLIDYKNGKTIVSDAIQYRIKIYDDKGNLVDSLVRQPENWQNAKSIDLQENVKNSFGDLMSEYKNNSLIQKVNFIDDDRILVSWTNSKNENIETFFDMWVKKEGRWALAGENMINKNIADEELFEPGRLKISGNYIVSGGRILSVLPVPIQMNKTMYNKTKKQVDSLINNYLYENELRYSVFEWEIK